VGIVLEKFRTRPRHIRDKKTFLQNAANRYALMFH